MVQHLVKPFNHCIVPLLCVICCLVNVDIGFRVPLTIPHLKRP